MSIKDKKIIFVLGSEQFEIFGFGSESGIMLVCIIKYILP